MDSVVSSIHSELGHLISLAYLDLSQNKFTGTIPTSIGDLEELTFLYLENNIVEGPSSI